MEYSLEQLSLVDSPATEDFDRLTRVASKVLEVPVALVSVIDSANDRQFFTSACGLSEPWASRRQTPLTHSFCQHVVTNGKPLVIEDARDHPLVQENLAIRDLSVIAYLGLPVAGPNGEVLGALCAIHKEPRAWSSEDVCVLSDLAGAVTSQIGLRWSLLETRRAQKAAAQLGNIVENSNHEVFMFDAVSLLFSDANKGARKNLGYSLQELRKLTPLDIKPEFNQFLFEKLILPLRNGETSKVEFETIHERKNGTRYPVSIRLEHNSDVANPVFIAFCVDISERIQLEQRLATETKNFQEFFRYSPVPMSISEMDTTILKVNPACELLFGMPSDALTGTQLLQHVPEEKKAEVERGFSQAVPDNPFFSILLAQVMNGVPKVVEWSNVVQFENGRASKIFSILKDVTELHQAKTIAEAKANEAKKAMEFRDVFLANMSHEVRTPLNAIMGLFQLIEMADVPKRQKKQAEVGLNASHHLFGQLVNVLELSRIEAAGIEITPKPTNIRTLAEQWLETARATKFRLKKPINLSLQIDEATPELLDLDERRVTQILNNLTDNALKFTNDGQVEIRVDPIANSDLPEKHHIEVSVSDTGCGIAPDKREAVFERFVQIDDAQTRENSGSGLGLAISRELAIKMGASLEVENLPYGSCFATKFALRLQFDR